MKLNYLLLHKVLLLMVISTVTYAKVTIFTHYFGQPEFIKYQHLFFEKNMLDEYELVVVEDAKDPRISHQIKQECQRYGITYVHVPRSVFQNPVLPVLDSYVGLGSASFECSVCVQYIYDNYVLPSKNVCMIIDNDIFLLSPLSVEEYIGTASFAYVPQGKGDIIHYMLPNFIIFNPASMPQKERLNFNMGSIAGIRTDSGGYTHFYLQDYKALGKTISTEYLCNTDSPLKKRYGPECPLLFNAEKWASHYFVAKEGFLHIRMGSNWSNDPCYSTMMQEVFFLFDSVLGKSEPCLNGVTLLG